MRCKKCTYLIFSAIIAFLFISGCKESPSFSVTNENDLLHEDFVLPVPQNLDISTVFRDSTFFRLNVFWDKAENENILDGYILKGYDSELKEFVEIKRLTDNHRGHELYEDDIDLKLELQVHSFITYDDDSIRISEPATVAYNQTIDNFEESLTKNGAFKLSWNHSIITSKARFYIERSINNSNFEFVTELNNRSNTFIDEVDFSIHDEISYRIFAKTEFISSDTLYATYDPIQLHPPQSIEFLDSDENQIDLAIVHTSFAESFQVALIMPDQSTYSSFEVPFSGTDTTFFTLQELPYSDKFAVLVRSKYKNNTSESIRTKLLKGPYLNYSRSVTLPTEEYYKPKLSADGSKLTFLTYEDGDPQRDDYYAVNVFDIANSQSIPLSSNVYSQYNAYDYVSKEELIYTVDEEYITAWNLNGNEIDRLHHFSNLDVYDMFIDFGAKKGVFKYDDNLNVYDLTDNSLENHYVKGYSLLPSSSGDFLFVYNNTYRNFFIQRHDLNNLDSYNQHTADYMPHKILIGSNDEAILISNNAIKIYNSSYFTILKTIESDFNEVHEAVLINQSVLAVVNNTHYLDFFDIYKGDHLGKIDLYDYAWAINRDLPSLHKPRIFYSHVTNKVYLLGQNEIGIFILTNRWIKSSQ